ncbi:hypothetical protein D3C87_513630 [compost metagenome]
MNKIFPKRDIKLICKEYFDFVEPKVKQRLNILIGFLLLREKVTIDLDLDQFTHNGTIYFIGSDPIEKRGIINSFFKKNGKIDRITVSLGKLQLPDLNDKSIYKPNLRAETLESSRFIELSNELQDLIKNEIDISSGSYLDRQRTYSRKLSKNEKIILSEIFPYQLFFQKKEHDWFYGSKLADDLNTPVCVYCNREYITSVVTSKKKKIIGPTFDHFLSQKDYPFLKLSFYNLIPSCTTCNSRLKNQIEFDFKYFLYPFQESYEGSVSFRIRLERKDINTKITSSALVQEQKLSFRIKSTPSYNAKLHGSIPKNLKKGNINVFRTLEVYNGSHKDVALEIIEKFQKMPKSQIESIYNVLKAQGKKHHEIYRFYFSNYPNEEDFNKRPLARMTRDLTEQLERVYKFGFKLK